MKKYLLKLVDEDINLIKHRISCWHKNLKNVTDIEYANKRFNALNNNLKKAESYRKRLENLF